MKFMQGVKVTSPDGLSGEYQRVDRTRDHLSVVRVDVNGKERVYPTSTLTVRGESGPCSGCGIILPSVYGKTFCKECSK